MKVGDKVKIRCFDGSIIDITITSIDEHNVYGTSDFGSHWANKKDVIMVVTEKQSADQRERERKWKRFKEYCIMSKELEELENEDV